MHRVFGFFHKHRIKEQRQSVLLIYTALLFLSFHWSLVVYVNSSFLDRFFTSPEISALYAIGSILSLICFFFVPSVLQRIGNYRLTLGCVLLEMSALIGMALASTHASALFYFLLHFVIVPLPLFCLDVFLEELSGKSEKRTGSVYGLKLSLLSLASALSQLLVGKLIPHADTSFVYVYLLSTLCLIPFIVIIHIVSRKFTDPHYIPLSIVNMISTLKNDTETRAIISISFFLQVFFVVMVIYTPLYLSSVIGFSWGEIGSILFVGLFAYVLFEWAIGIIADRYIGEKEMMALGFLIMIVSTSWFAFLTGASVGLWMLAMFLTRVGASLVETTCESYFFKHVISMDAHKLSLFRMMNPFASIICASLGGAILLFIPLNLFFIVVAFSMVPGLFLTLLLKDTK